MTWEQFYSRGELFLDYVRRYDEYGRLIRFIESNGDGRVGIDEVYSYDIHGNLTKIQYYSHGKADRYGYEEYSYDGQGNMVNRNYYGYYYEDNPSFFDSYYDYDEQGNILSEYGYGVDGEIIPYEIYQYW